MRNLMVCVVALAACGKGGDGDDWSKKPTKQVSGTVKGQAFTIELPEGMREKAEADEVRWDFLVDGRVHTPEISVRAGGWADSIEKYVESEKSVDNWLRKEATADGYIASYENHNYKGKEDYLVYVYKKVGDKVLTCSARVTPWIRGGKTKDKVPLVEKMCLSLKPAS